MAVATPLATYEHASLRLFARLLESDRKLSLLTTNIVQRRDGPASADVMPCHAEESKIDFGYA
jgi:hypothetical protein